jgi:hypothetical protein
MTIKSTFSNIATNPDFIAFNAHCWFAYMLVHTFHVTWVFWWVLIGSAIKEFYIDKHFESPPQSFMDNLKDWLGYALGSFLGGLGIYYGWVLPT